MLQVLAVFGIALILLMIICLVLYVIFAYALYEIAVKAELKNSWMAWIPILQLFILGGIIKTLKIFDYEIKRVEYVLPIAAIIVLAFNKISVIGALLSLANFILVLFALNKLYRLYKQDKAVLYTVLSIFGIPVPFIFMSIKDNEPLEGELSEDNN